ncbi:hypothetical protein LX15_006093 [Streptoalloteichus tenebrarius]|uniref:Uridine kinase n=1 Tax=Streptoalloteichus tenebrarius (strain ATCC 17920 / DSM 40477 / JCM 4838 / CBS 697.72 / NBRC 16177 / NCIMB 11028 / NRRL B-12390 / A12253. 1 / ISP 5477) TaxID=1933 RepID=A0ABT1I3J2_STRSD|nr:uridine kinase [Streptoalloteichus tenebrarius]MCP2262357.1 hypothetical protein [Streptoalloteichus tenebrarius]BFF00642.1 uridine kinase [Streptoalloteichus tenebrarius]
MRARPISPENLVQELATALADRAGDGRLRVAIDGPSAAHPEELADALVDPIRLLGHPVLRVSARDFLRPASLRYERGREDPDSYYEDWLDVDGLRREVLVPSADDGSGRVLPSLWNSETDRATRAEYVTLPLGGILLVDGTFLLAHGLPFDFSVHLWLSPAALARRTPEPEKWTLPAHHRYTTEIRPLDLADLAIRVDQPQRPALIEA